MKYFFLIIIFSINAFSYQSFIDTVYYYKIGTLEFQDSVNAYYPQNIFGKPSERASKDVPESSPEQILSIGIGGEIIVGFKDYIIKDGEGIDFVIFENAFINPINQGIFAEPAKVSVSFDGINYTDFPFDSTSLIGLAGITPTNGKVDISKYPACGGDGFDLSTIGIDKIKYIKIKDVSEILFTLSEDSKYYNPKELISGFDLDAVAGLNLELITGIEDSFPAANETIIYNEISQIIEIINPDNKNLNIQIINLSGKIIESKSISSNHQINIAPFAVGTYIIRIIDGNKVYSKKIIKG